MASGGGMMVRLVSVIACLAVCGGFFYAGWAAGSVQGFAAGYLSAQEPQP